MAYIPKKKNEREYKISLVSANSNTVAYINLTSQFLKAVTGKSESDVTFEDIDSINKGDLIGFIQGLDIKLEQILPQSVQDAKDF